MPDPTLARLTADDGTLPSARGPAEARRHRNGRRVVIIALFLFVLAGLLGFLGVRMHTTEGSADGWSLQVEAPQITRPALDSPIKITVSRDRAIEQPVRVRVDRAVFDHLDANLVAPAPSAESGNESYVEWTFEPPRGRLLMITVDARLSPTEMPGVTRLGFSLVDHGEVIVDLRPRLIRLP